MESMYNILDQLTTLSLHNCSIYMNAKEILAFCPNLISLTIVGCKNFWDFGERNRKLPFPLKLTECTLIKNCSINTIKVLKLITKHAPNLQKIMFDSYCIPEIDENEFSHLSTLENLISLSVNLNFKSTHSLLKALSNAKNKNLEILEISRATFSGESLTEILKLKNLKILILEQINNLTNENLSELVKNLKTLHILTLQNIDLQFKSETFSKIIYHAKNNFCLEILNIKEVYLLEHRNIF